jgi:hypothetical protein
MKTDQENLKEITDTIDAVSNIMSTFRNNEALLLVLSKLKAKVIEYANTSKWISVETELPKNGSNDFSDRVLAINSVGTCHVLRYDYQAKDWTNEPHSANITHWMPLPNAPEKP